MKSLFSITAILLISTSFLYANDIAYVKAMTKEISSLTLAKDSEEYKACANAFSRISEKNPEEWLPVYYEALALANAGFTNKNGMNVQDEFYDRALKAVRKAAYMQPNHSEITALEGFILMGKLNADPASRGQSLSPQVMQLFGKAIALDPVNPRAHALMAQMEYGMSQFFGQSPEKACQYAHSSIQLFEKEAAQPQDTDLSPRWGINMSQRMIEICQNPK